MPLQAHHGHHIFYLFVSLLRYTASHLLIHFEHINRIFEFLLKEKAAEVGSLFGFLIEFFQLLKEEKVLSFVTIWRRFEVLLVFRRFEVFKVMRAISSYQLALLYMLGLYISTGVSLWRLVQHDYGDTNGGENLKPGLKILYSLAVAQGVVVFYKTMFEFGARNVVVEPVADFYSLDTDLVSDYLEETLTGCMKDPSFATGRNLITYAVDLMESKLRNKHLSGVRILGTIMLQANFRRSGQADLMKQLLTGRACFSHMVQRLVERFGPRSPYNIEIRVHAATIMASVAGNIRLEQFPARMILEYIFFLLHPYAYEEYRWRPEGYEPDSHCLPKEYEQGWLLEGDELMHLYWHETTPTHRGGLTASAESDKGLMVQGLRILQKLIMHEDNCRVIINTEGMLSRVMAPLISDQLHRHHDDEWCSVAEESLELISRLLASPGEIGADMRRNISTNKEIVISTLKSIIACPKCEVLLKRQAVEMLLDLSENTPSIVITGSSSRRIFKWILLHIFIVEDKCFGKMCGSIHWAKKSTKIRRLAGERLQAATLNSQAEGRSTMSMLQQSVSSVIMGDLSRAIADDGDDTYRLHAVQILEHLCILYTKDDVFLEEMKKAILEVMRKVSYLSVSTSGIEMR